MAITEGLVNAGKAELWMRIVTFKCEMKQGEIRLGEVAVSNETICSVIEEEIGEAARD